LQRGRDWIWIAGNHDPEPAANIGGRFMAAFALGALIFQHMPDETDGVIAGHLHPVARVAGRGRAVSRRCFASDGLRMVMPAFGAYAGGLNVRDRAFANVFPTLAFTAHMLGERRIYAVSAKRCLPD
jgi:metallophosphoesterase superfamily enzyme